MTIYFPMIPNLIIVVLIAFVVVGSYLWGEDARPMTHREYKDLDQKLTTILEHVKNL